MKRFLFLFFIAIAIAVGTGFYVKVILEDNSLGDKIIGVSVVVGAFIFMPLFLYHRLKGKKLKDYTLTQENIKKMRDKGLD